MYGAPEDAETGGEVPHTRSAVNSQRGRRGDPFPKNTADQEGKSDGKQPGSRSHPGAI